jgi:two-component system nitrate/nitrite response regulator NarL
MVIRIFIAAQVRLYREGLADIVARERGLSVVGTTGRRSEIVAGVRALRPNVVLLDAALLGGLITVRELADGTPAKVVVLASPETEAAVVAGAEAGISGYVTHDDSPADLVATIRSVNRGDLLCSPRVAGALLRRVTTLASERSAGGSEARLTSRELQILRLLDEGLSNKQIARQLSIQLPTVKNHVHHILDKLGVARRGEAVARFRHGDRVSARVS